MKSHYQGYEWGKALCEKIEQREANVKRAITLAKKRLSDFEQGKVDACVDWLCLNRDLVKELKTEIGAKKNPMWTKGVRIIDGHRYGKVTCQISEGKIIKKANLVIRKVPGRPHKRRD